MVKLLNKVLNKSRVFRRGLILSSCAIIRKSYSKCLSDRGGGSRDSSSARRILRDATLRLWRQKSSQRVDCTLARRGVREYGRPDRQASCLFVAGVHFRSPCGMQILTATLPVSPRCSTSRPDSFPSPAAGLFFLPLFSLVFHRR